MLEQIAAFFAKRNAHKCAALQRSIHLAQNGTLLSGNDLRAQAILEWRNFARGYYGFGDETADQIFDTLGGIARVTGLLYLREYMHAYNGRDAQVHESSHEVAYRSE